MKMMRTLFDLSAPGSKVLKAWGLPEISNTGRFAAFSKSALDGNFLDTWISPLKSPVGSASLDAFIVIREQTLVMLCNVYAEWGNK